jgi:SAM-dependent methyltransferase
MFRQQPKKMGKLYPSNEDRRHPKMYHRSYLVLDRLRKYIQECVALELTGNYLRILDVGCGTKPYYPFFSQKECMYIGVDVSPNSKADILCEVEHLPLADESFDVVLCTQVLEHVGSPQDAIQEVYRALKGNGLLILSTHGIWYKHGQQDYWRWTDMGLRKILTPFFREVEIKCCGGTLFALFQILNLYVSRLPFGKGPIYLVNNTLGQWLDKIYWDEKIVINYFVVARK